MWNHVETNNTNKIVLYVPQTINKIVETLNALRILLYKQSFPKQWTFQLHVTYEELKSFLPFSKEFFINFELGNKFNLELALTTIKNSLLNYFFLLKCIFNLKIFEKPSSSEKFSESSRVNLSSTTSHTHVNLKKSAIREATKNTKHAVCFLTKQRYLLICIKDIELASS